MLENILRVLLIWRMHLFLLDCFLKLSNKSHAKPYFHQLLNLNHIFCLKLSATLSFHFAFNTYIEHFLSLATFSFPLRHIPLPGTFPQEESHYSVGLWIKETTTVTGWSRSLILLSLKKPKFAIWLNSIKSILLQPHLLLLTFWDATIKAWLWLGQRSLYTM